jgi:hypothetical protein
LSIAILKPGELYRNSELPERLWHAVLNLCLQVSAGMDRTFLDPHFIAGTVGSHGL